MAGVVITGGTAGVGRALARLYASDGWNVAVIARGEARLEATAKEIRSLGVRALAISADVADAVAMREAAARASQEFGGFDLWINNAMTTVYSPFAEMTDEEFRRVTDVVYMGSVNGARAALSEMRPARHGRIVFVGSALAYRSIPLQSAYCAAKHAVRGFVSALRTELIHDDVPVGLSMVQLPTVNTPQFSWCRNKMPRIPDAPPPVYSPEAVARGIRDAAARGDEEAFIGRSTVKLIAGEHVAPHLLDRIVAGAAWDGQQGEQRQDEASREGNLFEPAPGDPGSQGRFTAIQTESAATVSSGQARTGAALLAGGGAALALLAARRLLRRW